MPSFTPEPLSGALPSTEELEQAERLVLVQRPVHWDLAVKLIAAARAHQAQRERRESAPEGREAGRPGPAKAAPRAEGGA